MTIEAANDLISLAIDADQNGHDFMLPSLRDLADIGVMNLHKAYYDGGYAQHPEVKKLLQRLAGGALASVVRFIVDERVERGEYKRQTLVGMYNLVE